MKRMRTGRVALGAVTAALALAIGVFAGGTAQASTTAAGGTPAVAAASVQGPSVTCNDQEYTCQYNSGWLTYGRGACQVETIVSYPTIAVSPTEQFSDVHHVSVQVGVYSPYWFASCTAYSTVWLGERSGPPLSAGPFWGFACAVLDPTCPAVQWNNYSVAVTVPAGNPVMSISATDST
jgi:hypothetical protein